MSPLAWTSKQQAERSIAVVAIAFAVVAPVILNANFAHNVLTRTFFVGIAASSLIFLAAYGGMISLAQTALFGTAGFVLGNVVTAGGPGGTSKGLHLGWDPTLGIVLAIVMTTAIGLLVGLTSARSAGIYFLMITLTFSVIATYFFGQVTTVSGFSGIGGINRYTPGWIGDILGHPNRLYYISLGVALVVYVLIRYLVRTPFGITLQGVRDEPVRLGSLGYNVPLHRALAFAFAAFVAALAGILYAWWSGQVAPGTVDLPETINLLIVAVIGGLTRLEGAWLGAFAFVLMDNYITEKTNIPGLGFGGTLFGGRFPTVIGIIFLAIVVISPGGLMGIWDRGFELLRGGGWKRPIEPQTIEPGA
jgi:branched-chain amino acid transport system permease protein